MKKEITTESMSDEEFDEYIKPFEEVTGKYMENMIYDYVAFYIAKAYELNCLFNDKLEYHIKAALNEFTLSDITINFNYEKLVNILITKYNLKVIDKETSKLTKIKES